MAKNPVPPSCPECGRHLDRYDQTLVPAFRIHPEGEPGPENGTPRLLHRECLESAPSKWLRVEPE
jgi:hypothetical protein